MLFGYLDSLREKGVTSGPVVPDNSKHNKTKSPDNLSAIGASWLLVLLLFS
jgi:hypothetical protein